MPGTVRRDAQRNRQRLIDVALAAFSSTDTTVALEAIARDAGVGIGTLYRHFPTREALIEAVYRSELERLCDGATDLLGTASPADALRTWMARYADFVGAKRGMADALRTVIASGAITSADTRGRLSVPIRAMLGAGAEDGTLRADVAAEDVIASMAGILTAAVDRDQADRLLDLLMAGLRAR